jgi:hypothetical protein
MVHDTLSSQANAKSFYAEAEPIPGIEIEDGFEFRRLHDRDALGPQPDLVIAAHPRLDQDQAQLPDCPDNRYYRPQTRVHLGGLV